MKERFSYERVAAVPSPADPSSFSFRPVVPVTIFGLTGAFLTRGVLDTSAAETILPEHLVDDPEHLVDDDLIDPAFRKGEVGTLVGPDGTPFLVRYGTVDLAVRLKRRTHRWHAKVAFDPRRKDVLLGDAGFLRYFIVTFNHRERYTTLRPNGPFPPAIMPAMWRPGPCPGYRAPARIFRCIKGN